MIHLPPVRQRRELVRTCKQTYGLHVQPVVLKAMMNFLALQDQDDDDKEQVLMDVLSWLQQRLEQKQQQGPKIVSMDLWEEAFQHVVSSSSSSSLSQQTQPSMSSRKNNDNKNNSPALPFDIVQAFDTPKLVYDSLKHQFHYQDIAADAGARPPLLGTAQDKVDMQTQRYLQIYQHVARTVDSLTSIDRFLGTTTPQQQQQQRRKASNPKRFVLLGRLQASMPSSTSSSMGYPLELEDMTGVIPLDLCQASLDPSGMYCQGTLVMCRGFYDRGVFRVDHLGLAPLETKAAALPFLPALPLPSHHHQATTTTFHGKHSNNNNKPLSIYTMSNVAMDQPEMVQQLEDLLDHLIQEKMSQNNNNNDENVVLLLMGNFTTDTLTMSQACEELVRLLMEKEATIMPTTSSSGQQQRLPVLILPGPQDAPCSSHLVWPIPAPTNTINLQSFFASSSSSSSKKKSSPKMNIQFVSNPCRIYYQPDDGSSAGGSNSGDALQSIVVFRQDVLRHHLQQELLPVKKQQPSSQRQPPPPRLAHRVVRTLLSQGHLSTATTPTFWNYDHALSLYPLPDVLLLGLEPSEPALAYHAHSGDHNSATVSTSPSTSSSSCHVVAPGCQGQWAKVTLSQQQPKRRSGGGNTTNIPQVQSFFSQHDDDDSIMEDAIMEE